MAHQIEIDFEVLKALMALRETEAVSYNDVIRDLLKLGNKAADTAPRSAPVSGAGDWICKGVRFPVGTEFRANYKGQTYDAKVEEGALVVNGTRTDSPSDAAKVITGTSVNGWMFWECRFPGETGWRLIKGLRKSR